jgi:hypothetical protein
LSAFAATLKLAEALHANLVVPWILRSEHADRAGENVCDIRYAEELACLRLAKVGV